MDLVAGLGCNHTREGEAGWRSALACVEARTMDSTPQGCSTRFTRKTKSAVPGVQYSRRTRSWLVSCISQRYTSFETLTKERDALSFLNGSDWESQGPNQVGAAREEKQPRTPKCATRFQRSNGLRKVSISKGKVSPQGFFLSSLSGCDRSLRLSCLLPWLLPSSLNRFEGGRAVLVVCFFSHHIDHNTLAPSNTHFKIKAGFSVPHSHRPGSQLTRELRLPSLAISIQPTTQTPTGPAS